MGRQNPGCLRALIHRQSCGSNGSTAPPGAAGDLSLKARDAGDWSAEPLIALQERRESSFLVGSDALRQSSQEPEVLIVDEVLAVGDAAFQRKCMGKMSDVAKGQGRTIQLVSHNMPAVLRICL
jgi:hypothetical protein